MSAHVRNELYDFVTGSLTPEESAAVEDHLRRCPSCSADAETVRESVRLLPEKQTLPSDERGDPFWSAMLDAVDRRIGDESAVRRPRLGIFRPNPGIAARRRVGFAVGGFAALAMAAMVVFVLWPRHTPPPTGPALEVTSTTTLNDPEIAATKRLNEYFRKSKVIMVGLTNRKDLDPVTMDLSQEREQSRTLVREARELRRYPLDRRSDRLVGDVQKIMIGLSNINETHKAPGVDILLSGIQRENLLFRVRMAENFTNARTMEGNLQ